jgi:hypothetical protein
MEILEARRVLSADRRGSSWPVLVETDSGVRFTKLRGAAQGTGALIAEVIVAELAESLGLRVPVRSLVRFGDAVESVDKNDELADLLRASRGVNLGFAYLEGAENFSPEADVPRVAEGEAAAILWLDGLTTNPDRTARNPNLLWWRGGLWLIDHGAALGFQYALPAVDETATRRPYTLREPHILQSRVASVADWDGELGARVTHASVERAIAAVPDEFLIPLLDPGAASPESLHSRRQAYVQFLVRRLEEPRPFLETVVTKPNERPARGRPDWLARPR